MTLPADNEGPCSRAGSGADCSTRAVPGECLQRWRREATSGVVDTGRFRCRYFTWGQGPALVFVPGMCSDGRSFIPLMSRLVARFRCIGYDLPSGTDDGARLDDYRHEHLVADLLALLDAIDADRAHVVGQSFGSTIALGAVMEAPGRFGRVVLQSGFARRPLSAAELFVSRCARYLPGTLAQYPWRRWIVDRTHGEPFRARPAEDWHYYLECQGTTPVRAAAQRALLVHAVDLRPRLAGIRHPVLLLCGDRDPVVARALQDELQRHLASAAVAEIEQCGHHAHLSHPEVMAEVIDRFLSAPHLHFASATPGSCT